MTWHEEMVTLVVCLWEVSGWQLHRLDRAHPRSLWAEGGTSVELLPSMPLPPGLLEVIGVQDLQKTLDVYEWFNSPTLTVHLKQLRVLTISSCFQFALDINPTQSETELFRGHLSFTDTKPHNLPGENTYVLAKEGREFVQETGNAWATPEEQALCKAGPGTDDQHQQLSGG